MGFHHGLGLVDAIGDRLHHGGVGRHLSRLLRHSLHGIRSLHARRLRTGSRSLRRISRLSSRSRLRLHHGTRTGQILQDLGSHRLSLTLRIKHQMGRILRAQRFSSLQRIRHVEHDHAAVVIDGTESRTVHVWQIRELDGGL